MYQVFGIMDRCLAVLRTKFGSELEANDVDIEGQGNKGDGFINEIIYLHVTCHSKKYSLVAKMVPDFNKESMKSMVQTLFNTEVTFYEEIWPELDSFQRKNSNSNFLESVPKFFGSCKHNGVLVLENLKTSNFVMRGKKQMYDKKLVERLFQHFGYYHAVSFALKYKNYEEFKRMEKLLAANWTDFIKWDIIEDTMIRLSKMIPTLCTNSDAKERITQLSNNLMEEFYNVTLYKGNYHTLLHGDSWINNFLLKLDESGEIEDLRCLDFQLTQIGTPVYDLSYCFYSGATKDLLDDLDHYLKVYHKALTDKLHEFGCDVNLLYPFEALKEEWKQYSKFGFIISFMVWRGKTSENVVDLRDADGSDTPVDHTNCDEEMYARVIGDLIEHMYSNKYI